MPESDDQTSQLVSAEVAAASAARGRGRSSSTPEPPAGVDTRRGSARTPGDLRPDQARAREQESERQERRPERCRGAGNELAGVVRQPRPMRQVARELEMDPAVVEGKADPATEQVELGGEVAEAREQGHREHPEGRPGTATGDDDGGGEQRAAQPTPHTARCQPVRSVGTRARPEPSWNDRGRRTVMITGHAALAVRAAAPTRCALGSLHEPRRRLGARGRLLPPPASRTGAERGHGVRGGRLACRPADPAAAAVRAARHDGGNRRRVRRGALPRDTLEAAGIPVTVERLGDHHANLWATVAGVDPRPLVLLSHIDVEPVQLGGWQHPPFSGAIDPPWINGRGTFDMKSYAVAQMTALLDLQASGVRPRRTVMLMATSSEESGSDFGIRWLLREHPDLLKNAWAVLTEGGILEARNLEDAKYWATEFAQKQFVEVLACSGNRDRLEQLKSDLLRDGKPETGLVLTPEVADLWKAYGPTRDSAAIRGLLSDPQRLLHDPEAFDRLPPYLRSMMRNEAVPFSIEQDPEGGYQLRILLHLVPGQPLQQVEKRLLPDWITHGVSLIVRRVETAAHGSPLDHPAYRAIQAELEQDHADQLVGPYLLPWTATDARFLRLENIPTYGFTPFFILSVDTLRVGNRNEKIGLPGFHAGIELYTALLRRLVAAPAPSDR